MDRPTHFNLAFNVDHLSFSKADLRSNPRWFAKYKIAQGMHRQPVDLSNFFTRCADKVDIAKDRFLDFVSQAISPLYPSVNGFLEILKVDYFY